MRVDLLFVWERCPLISLRSLHVHTYMCMHAFSSLQQGCCHSSGLSLIKEVWQVWLASSVVWQGTGMESQLGYKSLNRLSFVKLSLNWLLFPHSSCPALFPRLSPTLSSPRRRGYLKQEPLARSQSVFRTMLWRGAWSLLPRPGLGQNTPGKVKASFSSCLCGIGRSWVSLLSWDTPHMHTSSYSIVCQQLWGKSISTFAWPSLLSPWGKQSLAGLCTPSKNPTRYLCCHRILQERIGAVQVMQCLFCSSQPLSGPPTETLLSLFFPRETQESTAGFNQKSFQGKPEPIWLDHVGRNGPLLQN